MNILVIKLSAIGDVIHALPVSRAVKETFPEARLTWAVEPPARDLLVDNPYIDEILVFEKKKFKASLRGFWENFFPFRQKLRKGRFDVALDLQGLGKSAAPALESDRRRVPKLPICTLKPSARYSGNSSTKLLRTFSISPRVSDERPAILRAMS